MLLRFAVLGCLDCLASVLFGRVSGYVGRFCLVVDCVFLLTVLVCLDCLVTDLFGRIYRIYIYIYQGVSAGSFCCRLRILVGMSVCLMDAHAYMHDSNRYRPHMHTRGKGRHAGNT